MSTRSRKKKAELKAVHPFRRWLVVGAASVAVLSVASVGGAWAYHHAKVWRARQLAGENPAESPDKAQGEARLLAAYNLAPHDPAVLRSCARYMASVGNPHALGFYHLLLLTPGSTRADQREAAAACLAFGDITAAKTVVDVLTAQDGGAEDFSLQAQVLFRERNAQLGIATMRHALELAPDNQANRLLLAEMLAFSGDVKNESEAVATLQDLSKAPDQIGLQALILLAHKSSLDESVLRDTLDRLRRHPLLDDKGRIAAWELERNLNPYQEKAILRQVVEYFKPTDVKHRAAAAHWLYDQGKPDLALELAPLADAMGNQDLFKVREDSLANLGQWTEVQKELSGPSVPLPAYLSFLYLARCAQQLGDSAGADADWDKARGEASHQPGALAELTDYAIKLGLYAEARKTLARMIQSPAEAKMGYNVLLQLEAAQGSSAEVLETLHQMTVDFPTEPEPKNDWAYLSLLMNQDVETATQIAHELVRDYPQYLAYRSTLALAFLRHNDPQGAAQAYSQLQIDWKTSPASWKMIYATVLAAQGKKNEGLAFVHDINPGQLRPVELAFFKTYFPGT